ncbi:adenosylcobinamide-GDP ribazoletransferase [Acinetobacter courvalinii]|uniref:adenosylcobinamide-GDP ribazoletransferase n=1 Tax=Acinetobacter courvalinii TaxID=280147 RepID=UPI0021CE6A6F|nr:adenosylcobinamide-GDP ribazoletransferase [Acinetobacter courvalinii]MCU4367099.1 adenosylcobinamide-GDP ribazoletransferase [Acinetobacter courvalinii]MCU4445305.1 adenosylcobinamide-GDP ribazoletransferase [Acinetobacter courvalinii]
MTPFWIALQFLTVLPIELKTMPSAKQNGQAMLFYPLVGLLLGVILFASAMLLAMLPIILSAALILVLWIWLTGGLHLDGLADTADAWVGGFGDPERTLNIMKDPACGPIGVLSLVVVCLLKFVGLYVLLEQHMAAFLIVLPILGRSVPVFLFLTTPYVRTQGLGRSMTDFMPKKRLWMVFVITIALLCMFKWLGLIALLVFLVMLFYIRSLFIKRIGGITGDTVGAAIELAETGVLLSTVIASFYII